MQKSLKMTVDNENKRLIPILNGDFLVYNDMTGINHWLRIRKYNDMTGINHWLRIRRCNYINEEENILPDFCCWRRFVIGVFCYSKPTQQPAISIS